MGQLIAGVRGRERERDRLPQPTLVAFLRGYVTKKKSKGYGWGWVVTGAS
jgi:hypothetical protein